MIGADLVPLRHVARLVYGDSLPTESRGEGQVPVYGSNGQTGMHSDANTLGPVVVVGRKGSQGKVQYSPVPVFAIDTTYFIDSRYTRADIRWLYYALSVLDLPSMTQDVGVPGLARENAYSLRVSLPRSVAAQRTIADYLDTETARIDTLIDRRRSILALLAERRRHASDAVIDQMSEGSWPQEKLKHVVDGFVDTLHATAPEADDGPGYIVGTPSIRDGSLDLSLARRCSIETLREWTRRAAPRAGDVLVTREAPAGEAALVPQDVPLAPGQRVVLIRTNPSRLLPPLVVAAVYSGRARRFFDQLSHETTVRHLNMADIGELPVVVPPEQLQVSVAQAISSRLDAVDCLTRAMSTQIGLLLERRQALITAAITGQLEIPGLAA